MVSNVQDAGWGPESGLDGCRKSHPHQDSIPTGKKTEHFSSVRAMIISNSDEDVPVPLVWVTHYPKCKREFWVYPMN
jgi:hypothetical protein